MEKQRTASTSAYKPSLPKSSKYFIEELFSLGPLKAFSGDQVFRSLG